MIDPTQRIAMLQAHYYLKDKRLERKSKGNYIKAYAVLWGLSGFLIWAGMQ